MTEDEYMQHSDENDGYCTTCREWTAFGGIEPDACKYYCQECKNMTVYGAQEAIMQNLIAIDED